MGEWIGAPRENYTPQGSCGWGLSQIPMGSSAQLPGVLSAGQPIPGARKVSLSRVQAQAPGTEAGIGNIGNHLSPPERCPGSLDQGTAPAISQEFTWIH